MKKLNTLIRDTQTAIREKSGDNNPASNGYSGESAQTHDHVDAVNQMFAEFELAYHNQFHKAFAREGSLAIAKKYWLSCLAPYSPQLILKATRKVVGSQEFLPTLSSIIQACENAWELYGLPPVYDAYREVCLASEPKLEYHWSHPAVYLAGKATGWFSLATETEARIFPLFEYHYRMLCDKAMSGESLSIKHPSPLPKTAEKELSPEENREKMRSLRKSLKL